MGSGLHSLGECFWEGGREIGGVTCVWRWWDGRYGDGGVIAE